MKKTKLMILAPFYLVLLAGFLSAMILKNA